MRSQKHSTHFPQPSLSLKFHHKRRALHPHGNSMQTSYLHHAIRRQGHCHALHPHGNSMQTSYLHHTIRRQRPCHAVHPQDTGMLSSYFSYAVDMVKQFLKVKVFSNPGDEFALLFYGTVRQGCVRVGGTTVVWTRGSGGRMKRRRGKTRSSTGWEISIHPGLVTGIKYNNESSQARRSDSIPVSSHI